MKPWSSLAKQMGGVALGWDQPLPTAHGVAAPGLQQPRERKQGGENHALNTLVMNRNHR